MTWYNKYLNIYGKPFSEVSPIILVEIKNQLASLQSIDPLVSIVVSAYNEEKRLAACLWSLSDLKTQYPIEILGVNNNSNDKTGINLELCQKSLVLVLFGVFIQIRIILCLVYLSMN